MSLTDDHDPERHGDKGQPAGLPDAGAMLVGNAKLIEGARKLAASMKDPDQPIKDDVWHGACVIERLVTALEKETDRADFAWQNTREIDKARMKAESALAAAKLDSERLDWLQAHPLDIGWRQGNGQDFFVFVRRPLGNPDVNLRTFRAAIDAARQAQS